jgi:nicotinate-nucleotide adenylyltransferase
MSKSKHRIAVFGGTFDPPHRGHAFLVQEIIRRDLADEILFVPAFKPPHKPGQTSASFKDRLVMISLVADILNRKAGKKFYSVSALEGDGDGSPSYTYNTMLLLRDLYPEAELSLLIGGDSLRNFHTWYMAGELISNWKILTYPRSAFFLIPEEIHQELRENWSEEIASLLFKSILPLDMCDISSTKIREELNSNKGIVYSLDPVVYKYIEEEGLYKNE